MDHKSFCDEVGRTTTFTGAEVEAVLRLAAEIAKRHVENGDIVEFGDIGTLTPSFQSKILAERCTSRIAKGTESFFQLICIIIRYHQYDN